MLLDISAICTFAFHFILALSVSKANYHTLDHRMHSFERYLKYKFEETCERYKLCPVVFATTFLILLKIKFRTVGTFEVAL